MSLFEYVNGRQINSNLLFNNVHMSFTDLMVDVGLGSYSGRFIFGSVLGFAAQMLVKPSVSYTKEGRMKPFTLLAGKEGAKDSTYLPWWMLSLLPGIAAVLFI